MVLRSISGKPGAAGRLTRMGRLQIVFACDVLADFTFPEADRIRHPPPRGNAVKHFVAKLVKSFGGLCYAAESLDDFRYFLDRTIGSACARR